MANKLNENYIVKGTTATKFLEEAMDMHERTTYPVVSPDKLYLLSFKEKITKKVGNETEYEYIFYKLSREELNMVASGKTSFYPISCKVKTVEGRLTPRIELFDEVSNGTGLMLAYEDDADKTHYCGVSRLALKTLCKRAELPGDRIYVNSLWRDVYIADGLLPKVPLGDDEEENRRYDNAISEGIKLVVRHNVMFKDGKKRLYPVGMVVGVFSEGYNETGTKIIADLYEKLKSTKMGKVNVSNWEVSQSRVILNLEFPEAAEAYREKYGYEHKIIPGITLTTSDCGFSSLTVSGTYRTDDSQRTTIVKEFARKHVGEFTAEDIMERIEKEIISHFEEYPKEMGKLSKIKITETGLSTEVERQTYKEKVRAVVTKALSYPDIKKSVGKKREEQLIDAIPERIGEFEGCTLYDIVRALMCVEDIIYEKNIEELGETSHNQLVRSIAPVARADYYESLRKTAAFRSSANKKIQGVG